MRQTDSNIWQRMTDLMRSASVLLLSALTVLAVVSCSGGGDDDVTPEPKPVDPDPDVAILFSALEQAESDVTRAATPLEEKVQKFTVYGYKNKTSETYPQLVFPGYIVKWIEKSANSTSSNTNDWEYVNQQPIGASEQQTIKYWDWESSAYRFFGHTAENAVESVSDESQNATNIESGSVVLGNETANGISYRTLRFKADSSDPDAAPYFSSLWYSTGVLPESAGREYGKPVQLSFTKPFARVRIMIKKSNEDAALLLENMSFKPYEPQEGQAMIITAGTFKVSYPVSGSETQESFSIDNPTGIDAFTVEYTENNPRWYTVIAKSQGPYALYIEVNGEPRNVVLSAEYMNWQPGYQYTYTFKITEEGGVEIGTVQTAYTDWAKVEEKHEVHNW